MDKIEEYVKISKEYMETSLILQESKKYRNSTSSSYHAMFSIAKYLLIKEDIETQRQIPNL